MSKKLPLSKKQLVVAGVTSAGLFLSPTVFADEASVPSTLASPSAPASQVSPTPETGLAVTTATSVSADVNASTTSSESSEVVSSEVVSTSVSTSQVVPTVTAQAAPAVSSSASASQVAHARVVARLAVTPKESVAKVSAADLAKVDTSDIQGRTHLQVKGWQKPVSATHRFGTVGESRRLEAVDFSLTKDMSRLGDLVYQSHVQDIGWQAAVTSGHVSGTTGQSRRLEAINMHLTAELAAHFDLYYRTHIQDYGWLGWAKNGANAGTEGLSLRLEAIEVQLLPKGAAFKGDMTRSFIKKGHQSAAIVYRTYIEEQGWQSERQNGALSGSTGKNQQIEALGIRLQSDYLGHVSYQTHIQNIGWVSSVGDGKVSGQGGSHRQIEAIKVSLVGEISKHYDLYYRVHSQQNGWLGWTKNGLAAGTEGFTLGVEGLEVTLVKKGGRAPGTTANPFMKKGATVKPRVYPMPYFNQRDSRWVSKYYGRYTMEDAGCVPTVLAMLYSGLESNEVLPTTVADWLYKNTTTFNKIGQGTFSHGIGQVSQARGYQYAPQKSLTELENTLKQGYSVAAAVGLGNFVWYGGTHEILLQGYSNGKTYVRDPYRDFLNGWYSIKELFKQQSWNPADRELGSPFIKISKS